MVLFSMVAALILNQLWTNGAQGFPFLHILINTIYYLSSLIAQLVKNLPAMQETPVQFLGQEDTLEKGKATHSSILA